MEKEFYADKNEITPDPLTYQGVRMSHLCLAVWCGQCEDVCPMEIPRPCIPPNAEKIQGCYWIHRGVNEELHQSTALKRNNN